MNAKEEYVDAPRETRSKDITVYAIIFLVLLVGAGIFFAVKLLHKPADAALADSKSGIIYDSSAVEGGWDNLSPEEIAEKLNEKVAEGMINISMNTAPYFENGTAEGNVMIVNEDINLYPSRSSSSATTHRRSFISPKRSLWAARSNVLPLTWSSRLAHTNAQPCSTTLIRSVAKSSAQPGQLSQSPSRTNFQNKRSNLQ